jgi:isoquinoline 1-oxidoreductase subunit alpha
MGLRETTGRRLPDVSIEHYDSPLSPCSETHCSRPGAREDGPPFFIEAKMAISFTVNGRRRSADVAPETPVLWVLRDALELTGTKFGCGLAQCGACTVHLDGAPIRSCSVPVAAIAGRKVTTIESLSATKVGKALQAAWIAEEVPQCGYCQSGQLMSAAALLERRPNPTDEEIDEAMSGNLCRCGTYQRIRRAIHRAAKSA